MLHEPSISHPQLSVGKCSVLCSKMFHWLLLYLQITKEFTFLTVYFTPPLLHVSTHARHHQGAFLCLLIYIQIVWYPVVNKTLKYKRQNRLVIPLVTLWCYSVLFLMAKYTSVVCCYCEWRVANPRATHNNNTYCRCTSCHQKHHILTRQCNQGNN
jgi:hypothetical protein